MSYSHYCDDSSHEDTKPRHAHAAHDAIDDLVDDLAKMRESRDTLVRELTTIADRLGVDPSFKLVTEKIDALLQAEDAGRETASELANIKHATNYTFDEYMREIAGLRGRLLAAEEREAELKAEIERLLPDATVGAAEGGLSSALTMLARDMRDPGAAKNYVELQFSWDDGILPQLPFRRATVTFYRDGGMSPHQRAEAEIAEARRERDEAREGCARLKEEADLLDGALRQARAERDRVLAREAKLQEKIDALGRFVLDDL